MGEIRRIGFVVNAQKPRAHAVAANLANLLKSRGVEFFGEREVAPLVGIPAADAAYFKAADLVVVLGGDGTMIRAVRLLGDAEVPLLGVHLGSLGFMMENMADEARAALEGVLSGDFMVMPRLKLRVRVYSGTEQGETSPFPRHEAMSLNEAVVGKGPLSRIIELKTSVDGLQVTSFRADGVIVSTPTGSTGYSLSAGGPILAPSLQAIVVNPICPHTLAHRPLVIPGESHIELSLMPGSDQVFLTIDGQQSFPLEPFDRIRIEAAKSRALLVRNGSVDFFSILRSRLGWGGGGR